MTKEPGMKRLPRWVKAAWLPGAILLVALIAVAFRYGESARFAEMLSRAEPIWLVVAAVLQFGTYFCTAVILKLGLRRSGAQIRMRSLVPLGLVKLFIDQVVPTGGNAGPRLIIPAPHRRGVPPGASPAS